MNIPKKLKIGGHIYDVDCSQELEGKQAETDYRKHLIRICKAIPQSSKEATLIHEIIHVMNPTFSDSREGHSLQDSLSEQIYQVLSDNKLLK